MAINSPIKISAEADAMVSQVAHFTHQSKKQVVENAVREYIEKHRDEINQGIQAALQLLDGSSEADAMLLTGFSSDELNDLGGVEQSPAK